MTRFPSCEPDERIEARCGWIGLCDRGIACDHETRFHPRILSYYPTRMAVVALDQLALCEE
jgi:hypothetical protein